jgi:hypothetical protein
VNLSEPIAWIIEQARADQYADDIYEPMIIAAFRSQIESTCNPLPCDGCVFILSGTCITISTCPFLVAWEAEEA